MRGAQCAVPRRARQRRRNLIRTKTSRCKAHRASGEPDTERGSFEEVICPNLEGFLMPASLKMKHRFIMLAFVRYKSYRNSSQIDRRDDEDLGTLHIHHDPSKLSDLVLSKNVRQRRIVTKSFFSVSFRSFAYARATLSEAPQLVPCMHDIPKTPSGARATGCAFDYVRYVYPGRGEPRFASVRRRGAGEAAHRRVSSTLGSPTRTRTAPRCSPMLRHARNPGKHPPTRH